MGKDSKKEGKVEVLGQSTREQPNWVLSCKKDVQGRLGTLGQCLKRNSQLASELSWHNYKGKGDTGQELQEKPKYV